ncbi:MAG: transglutaminase-like domain-containing protein [Thermoleophilia bacterium]|nr:transglutaminase-like domain-containing protein [Thermoleophilia bacterium]
MARLPPRWLRTGGGFVYDERPPLPKNLPPLVDFEQRTKSGYCQHFAGTMALMLRYLGIPARVAVGFSSGTWKDNGWTVTDHDAYAWVEVWFAGYGWLPFDPTPGRGTLSATYTNASDSADAIRALGTGRFLGSSAIGRTPTRRGTPTRLQEPVENGVNSIGIAPFALILAGLLVLAGAKGVRRFTRSAVRDPRGRASAARAELAAFICDQGAPVTVSAPVSQLVVELRALGVGSDAFASAFSRARYGPPTVAAAAANQTRRERLGPGRRLRGFFVVRSLRKG